MTVESLPPRRRLRRVRAGLLSTEQLTILTVLYDGGLLIWKSPGRRGNGAQAAARWYMAEAGTPHPDTLVDATGLDRYGWWEPGRGEDRQWATADGRAIKGLLSKGLLDTITEDRPGPRGRGTVGFRVGARITTSGRQLIEEERTGRVDRRTREARAAKARESVEIQARDLELDDGQGGHGGQGGRLGQLLAGTYRHRQRCGVRRGWDDRLGSDRERRRSALYEAVTAAGEAGTTLHDALKWIRANCFPMILDGVLGRKPERELMRQLEDWAGRGLARRMIRDGVGLVWAMSDPDAQMREEIEEWARGERGLRGTGPGAVAGAQAGAVESGAGGADPTDADYVIALTICAAGVLAVYDEYIEFMNTPLPPDAAAKFEQLRALLAPEDAPDNGPDVGSEDAQ